MIKETNPATQPSNTQTDAAVAPALVKARVLRDHGDWKADDVVLLNSKQLKSLGPGGVVDADPDSVEYAESLKKNGDSN